MLKFADSTYVDYALQVLSNKKTLQQAQDYFKSQYWKFLNLYAELKKLKEAVDITKKLTDTGTKMLAVNMIRNTVTKINDIIEKFRQETYDKSIWNDADAETNYKKLVAEGKAHEYQGGVEAYRRYSYKEWSISLNYDIGPTIEYPHEGEDFEPYIDSLERELTISYWKKDISEKTYYHNFTYDWRTSRNGTRSMSKDELDAFINKMLVDIGYVDDVYKRQQELQRNKGLQALALMINWN